MLCHAATPIRPDFAAIDLLAERQALRLTAGAPTQHYEIAYFFSPVAVPPDGRVGRQLADGPAAAKGHLSAVKQNTADPPPAGPYVVTKQRLILPCQRGTERASGNSSQTRQ